jgi:hypothetical protein
VYATPHVVDELVERGVIRPVAVPSARRQLRRLPPELLVYDAAWLDALRAEGELTSWQAGMAASGQAAVLRAGPFVLLRPLRYVGYGWYYHARHVETHVQQMVLVAEPSGTDGISEQAAASLVEKSSRLETVGLLPVTEAGIAQGRFWAAARLVPHTSLAEFLAQYGRFSPELVLHVARCMVRPLALCERLDLPHGDIRAEQVLLCDHGELLLAMPGVRGLLRPVESAFSGELTAELLDGVAPERLMHAAPPSMRSDLYACGILWRHMLAGKQPCPGVTPAARLAACERLVSDNMASLRQELPRALLEAIEQCTQFDPANRPRSFVELASRLGMPTAAGRAALGRAIRSQRGLARWVADRGDATSRVHLVLRAAAAAIICLAVALVVIWPRLSEPPSARGNAVRGQGANAFPRGDTRERQHGARHTTDPQTAVDPSASTQTTAKQTTAKRTAPKQSAPKQSPNSQTHGTQTAGIQGEVTHTARSRAASRRPQRGVSPPANERPQPLPPSGGELPDEASPGTEAAVAELLLPQGRLNDLSHLELKPGMVVRPAGWGRAAVAATEGTMLVAAEDVRFVDLDFVPPPDGSGGYSAHGRASPPLPEPPAPLLRIAAWQASFQGCTFYQPQPQSAVEWDPPPGNGSDMNTGKIQFSRCVWYTSGPAIRCLAARSIALHIADALIAGNGPLFELAAWPDSEDLIAVRLHQATLRGVQAVAACPVDPQPDRPGRLAIHATRCALALGHDGALILFTAPPHPSWIDHLSWHGEEAVLPASVPVLAWRGRDGKARPLEGNPQAVRGLVRGELDFAGPPDDLPLGSTLRDVRAPLRGTQTPGASVATLPRPPTR